jgi:methionine-S-sulfoxide reductase
MLISLIVFKKLKITQFIVNILKEFIYFQGFFVKILMLFIFLSFVQSTIAFAKPITETATFAAGCFWGTEEFFRNIPGVVSTIVGYTGGTTSNPKYEDMHDGHTGHAESVEIVFDSKTVTYVELLNLFFKMHDPTTLNKQGNDSGIQYRSAIFYHSDKQKIEAKAFKLKVDNSKAWKSPVMTEISAANKFWPAEEYHQKYLVKHPGGYDNHFLRKITF